MNVRIYTIIFVCLFFMIFFGFSFSLIALSSLAPSFKVLVLVKIMKYSFTNFTRENCKTIDRERRNARIRQSQKRHTNKMRYI